VGGKLSAVKLAAQAAAGNKVTLKWSPKDSAVKQYQVERKEGRGAFATVATVGAAKMDYEDGSVKPGVSYTYRIEAVPAVKGASAFSNEVTVKTQPRRGQTR
jgi:fibronectin type 3 domain-containing protein